MKPKHPARPADDARQYTRPWRAEISRISLRDACRHTALIDVSSYPAETEMPSFRPHMKCGRRNVDVRPNWKEQPPSESLTGKQWR
jgi:hypothetical protein